MKKRNRFVLVAVLAIMICALGLVLYISHEPPEPSFKGKPLSYWLTGYDPVQFQTGHAPRSAEADGAIQQMGTNCIPRLLRMLQRHDSPFKAKVRALLDRQKLFSVPFLKPNQDVVAYYALCALGATASNAVPELIRIYATDSSPEVQQYIIGILGKIGPGAGAAIPMLLRATSHTNYNVSIQAIWALGEIHADAEKVAPALMKFLKGPDLYQQALAMQSLGRFGTNAQMAVPVLVELLRKEIAAPSGTSWQNMTMMGVTSRIETDTNEFLCTNAVCALGAIHVDPDDVVPILVTFLNSTNIRFQADSVRSLSAFGTNARSALPALVERLRRYRAHHGEKLADFGPSRAQLIEITGDAIKLIDPGAAAKAGVK